MQVYIDQKSDAIHFRLDDSAIIESEKVSLRVILDFNRKNQVVGFEILNAKKRVPEASLTDMKFEVA